jgi:hypothetical protein
MAVAGQSGTDPPNASAARSVIEADDIRAGRKRWRAEASIRSSPQASRLTRT